MPTTRREFLTATAAATLGLGAARATRATAPPPPRAGPSLHILILGGTTFLGPHQVRYLLERGHRVSIFTRGRTQPTIFRDAFDHVEHLVGDRENDLSALEGRSWDAVIDNSGRKVRWARDSATLLRPRVGRYLYVSSTGVYLPYRTVNITEDTDLVLADDPPQEEPSYGVMKSLSEIAVREAFGDGALIVRPTYIVGPADPTDRFTYWPVRVSRGGEILVPGRRNDPVQFIDVRDLTEWMVHLVENQVGGTFNAAGPASPLTMEGFVYGVRAATTTPLSWTWIEDYAFLRAQNLLYAIPWLMAEGDWLGSARINIDRALAAGLFFRPLATTVRDTLEWWRSDLVTQERRDAARFVLSPEREREILQAWKRHRESAG